MPRRTVWLAAVVLAVLVAADVTVERARDQLNAEYATQLLFADVTGFGHELHALVAFSTEPASPSDRRLAAAELRTRIGDLRALLPRVDAAQRKGDAPAALARDVRDVVAVAERERELTASGDVRAAARLHERRADPALARLDATIARVGGAIDARATALERRSRLTTHATFVGTALLVLLLLVLLVRSARRGAGARSDRRYRAIAEFGADVSIQIAGDGVVRAVTGPVEPLLGRPAESIVGHAVHALADPADASLLRGFLADAATRPGGGGALEWRARRADGTTVALESTATNLLADPDVGALVLMTRDVSARRALEEQLRHRAFHDGLTRLPNRALFEDRLERALTRRDNRVAVLLVELDDFKLINDRLGRSAGDAVLGAVADVLRACVRSSDTPARLGGDEFVVLLDGVESPSEAVEVAERVLAELRRPLTVAGEPLVVGASIGVSAPGTDADGVLRQGDLALYAAKASGKGHLELFDDALEAAFGDATSRDDGRSWLSRGGEQRAEILATLEREDSIAIVFQPIVDLRDAAPAGYEALARFPAGSGRTPDVWFKQAHRFGLGAQLEAHALRAALAHPGRPAGTYLALNVSPSSLVSAEVQAVLPADLTGIVIEITEHELVLGGERLLAALADVRRRGGRIAVDDAGAGYTGLHQLTQLRPDIVKLDRALVDGVAGDPAKASLIEAFVRFARRIGASVCAEGIEQLADLRTLADLDVAYGQGYALARPAPPWAGADRDALETLRSALAASLEPTSADVPQAGFGDRVLELVGARLSAARTPAAVAATFPLIARCLHADELAYSDLDVARQLVSTLDPDTWTRIGDAYRLDDFPATRHVLDTHEVMQIRAGDPDADPSELSLLVEGGYRSVLLIPVLASGASVGLLEAYSHDDRPWTRQEISRARSISYQLGGVVTRLTSATVSAARAD